ncbi:MAG TPA: CHAT domain-containing tetratricopeptide repeat protein [Terriglobales bacterium]|nr:CHAT domain-containing tetratricopeptide repeat protein [Terriglobales bacterium]
MILEHREEQALAVAAEAHALAVQHLDACDVEYVLAFSYLASARVHAKDEQSAIEILETVASVANTVLSELPEERHALLNNLAICYYRTGHPEKTVPLMEQVVADKAKIYGENSMELVGNLEDLVMALDESGRFGDAEGTLRQLLQTVEIEFGAESRQYVQSLSNLAACLRHAGKREEVALVEKRIMHLTGALEHQRAEHLEEEAKRAYLCCDFLRAKKLHRALLAGMPSSPLPAFFTDVMGDMFDPLVRYAATLDHEGVEAEKAGDFARAIQRYRAIVEIFSVSGDRYGIQTAQALNNLALAHQRGGDLKEAQHWFTQAVRLLGPVLSSEKGAPIISNVVALFWALCDRDAPDPAKNLDAALALLNDAARNKGKDYARSLRARFPLVAPNDDSAEEFRKWIEARIVFYLSFGAVEPARALRTHVLELHELLFAREPRRILEPLLSSIAFCIERGPIEQARKLLDRAEQLSAELLEHAPAAAARVLRWEARFRSAARDDATAEDALLSARDLLSHTPSEQDTLSAIEDDLLVIWMRSGKRSAEVDKLLDRVISSERASLQFENPEDVQHLGTLLTYKKDWGGAEALFRKALEKQKDTIGEWDPRYALTLSNLGSLLRMRGRAAEAAPLLRQAVRTRELEFGASHQSTVRSRIRLALALGSMGQWKEAMEEMRQVMEANELFLGSTAAVTSREQLFHVLAQDRTALDVFITIALNLPNPERATLAYTAILRRKGLAAEAFAARRLPVLSDRYPEQRTALAELDHISSILSEALISSHRSADDLKEARARKQRLETELAAAIPEMRFEAAWRDADADAIRRGLDEKALLLEYVQFRPFNFRSVATDDDCEMLPPRYLGFVVVRDQEALMVDIGPAAEIDESVAEFGKLLAGEASGLRNFSAGDEDEGRPRAAPAFDALRSVGQRVRSTVWDPLFPEFSSPEHVLVAPDGFLSLLPFDLLPLRGSELLIDTLLISNVGSGRDVLRLKNRSSGPTSQPVIFCAPDFDLVEQTTPTVSSQRDFVRAMNRFGIRRVSPLPGAEREGRKIRELLPGSQMYAGAAATESAFRSLRSPLALHIATHGFSIQPKDDSAENDAMFYSGLLLAGANTALRNTADDSSGDAILTGEEAATLNLLGTELVVLSACRSGLGRTIPGEGVFGLHRAFSVAGARCVISSLWKIPDAQTTELMTCLYQELLQGGSRASALREAKRRMRMKHSHPFFWGSFLCHGDWREIPELASRSIKKE